MPLSPALPGLALSLVVALTALALNRAVPLLSALLVAILLGVLARNLRLVPSWAEAGLGGKLPLRLGVALLGLQLSVPAVLELGAGVVGVIVITTAATFALVLLGGRLLGTDRDSTVLVATGCAICGASAIAAVAAVLPVRDRADRERLAEAAAAAVATVTLFGTVALLLVPVLAGALGLDEADAGIWVGASVHEVGQVVAGAGLVGGAAMSTAVVTKLGRVVLLAPLVAVVGWWDRRARARTAGRAPREARDVDTVGGRGRAPLMPWFVAVFLALVVLRSLTDLPAPLLQGAGTLATVLLTMGMLGMGLGVRLDRLARTGGPALLLGGGAAVVSAGVSLAAVLLLV